MAMELDLETFLVALYVIVDDLYQSDIAPRMPACGGPPAQRSDSEVLCLGLAVQWRSGVPWKSERGIMRYVRNHLRHLFPTCCGLQTYSARLANMSFRGLTFSDTIRTHRLTLRFRAAFGDSLKRYTIGSACPPRQHARAPTRVRRRSRRCCHGQSCPRAGRD